MVTNFELDEIYAFGLNGNAKKLANSCDSNEVGKCGCVHAENNALIKVGQRDPKKIIFVTHSPCLACAKLIINSGASYVYYATPYRDPLPIQLLHSMGIRTCPYPIVFESDTFGGVRVDWIKKPSRFIIENILPVLR